VRARGVVSECFEILFSGRRCFLSKVDNEDATESEIPGLRRLSGSCRVCKLCCELDARLIECSCLVLQRHCVIVK
jgi:hypothetical protein